MRNQVTFFVTRASSDKGADLGGLAGADRLCQRLAQSGGAGASHSWNSSHPSRGRVGGCSQADLRSTGGDGLFYCFAAE
jgi:hypothetical protein